MQDSQKGQSLVEMALILPILLLLLMGIIDFGWIFANQIELQNAARDGARYASVNTGKNYQDVKDYLEEGYALIKPDKVVMDFDRDNGMVELGLNYELDIITPFTGAIIGNPFAIKARMIMSSE